jgi:hypothetical protein
VRVTLNHVDWECYCVGMCRSWYIPAHHVTSVQARTRREILHCTTEKTKNHRKNASPREMQNSLIAHIGIGSPLEDDNTTSTELIFVVLQSIFGVCNLLQSRVFYFNPSFPSSENRCNENKETSSDFHCCCVKNNSNKT